MPESASPGEADVDRAAESPLVSIVVVNFNHLHHLRRCLPSLFAQAYPHYEVLMVDNASTDGSLEYVEREFPTARIIRNASNLGYAGGNNVGFRHARGDYIAVLNPDTAVEPDWLTELVRALADDPRAGLATPKILLMDDPTRINTCGNDVTLTGLTFCRGLDVPAVAFARPEYVAAVSGAAFVIRKAVVDDIGGFDEAFFTYYEDTDLSLRAALAGYACLYVPTSRIYHKYVFKFSPRKCFWQERNRYFALVKVFRWRTLLAMLPALLISEVIAWTYAAMRGREHLAGKARSYISLARHCRDILDARQRVQRLRRVDDRVILQRIGYHLSFTRAAGPGLSAALRTLTDFPLWLLLKVTRAIVTW